jgi:Glycosyltransferase family 87
VRDRTARELHQHRVCCYRVSREEGSAPGQRMCQNGDVTTTTGARSAQFIALLCHPVVYALTASLYISIMWALAGPRLFDGPQDFSAFYYGAKTVGTPYLYSGHAVEQWQARTFPPDPAAYYYIYIRLPFEAALLKPISWLPYQPALIAWKIVSILALFSAIPLLAGRRPLAWMAICCAPATWQMVQMGQDTFVPFVAAAASFYLLSKCSRKLQAGCALGLVFALKPHLSPVVLFVLLLRREFRMLGGVMLTCAAAAALSFTVQPGWVGQWLSVVKDNAQTDHAWLMPSVMSLLATPVGKVPLIYALILICAATAIALLSRRMSLSLALATSLTVAILVSPHSYGYDWLIAIPGLLFAVDKLPSAESAVMLLICLPTPLLALGMRARGVAALTVTVACVALYFIFKTAQDASPADVGT